MKLFPARDMVHVTVYLSFSIDTQNAFDSAVPSNMKDVRHHDLSNYGLARHESPSSSVVGTSDQFTEGHKFDFRRGLSFFSLSQASDKLNIIFLLSNVVFLHQSQT